MSKQTLNWPVVLTVMALCAISLTLFFIQRQHNISLPEAYTPSSVDSACQLLDESDADYYNQLADEYIADLPSDKELIARLVDSNRHHIVYIETTDHPSCYSLDLESLTTSVVFGGEEGFYCGTKLLIIGTIRQWQRVNDTVYFIADNRAPESSQHNAVQVFFVDLSDNSLHYLDTGFDAAFLSGNRLYVGEAKLLYHSLFTGEDVYDEVTVTFQL